MMQASARPRSLSSSFLFPAQVYHLCNSRGGGIAFECPGGTRFKQDNMVCAHWAQVDCQASENFYHMNERIGQRDLKLIDGERCARPSLMAA